MQSNGNGMEGERRRDGGAQRGNAYKTRPPSETPDPRSQRWLLHELKIVMPLPLPNVCITKETKTTTTTTPVVVLLLESINLCVCVCALNEEEGEEEGEEKRKDCFSFHLCQQQVMKMTCDLKRDWLQFVRRLSLLLNQLILPA